MYSDLFLVVRLSMSMASRVMRTERGTLRSREGRPAPGRAPPRVCFLLFIVVCDHNC